MLALLGAAIGTSRVLEVKPGWHERPLLWTAVVAGLGSKKSPALGYANLPLREVQSQLLTAYKQARETYSPECGADLPVLMQLFTTDTTVEGLTVLLEQNPRGIVYIQDELTSWVYAMNQYRGGKGADRQTWLSFWNGAPVLVNRKHRKEPIVLPHPFVSVTGCLPPEVLGDLADARGREDSFMHRILFACPDPLPSHWTDVALSEETRNGYTDAFKQLRSLQPATSADDNHQPRVIQFSRDGKEAFVTWLQSHHTEQAAKDFPEHLCGPYAKLEGYCARLALILQECGVACHEAQQETVDEPSVRGAIALMNYFKQQAQRVYTRLQTSAEEQRIAKACAWLTQHNNKASLRDFVTYKVAGCKTRKEAWQLLQALEFLGHGSITTTTPVTGGPKSHCFTLK
jgi:hypothetical protein